MSLKTLKSLMTFLQITENGKSGRGLHYTQIQVVENLPNNIIQNPRPPRQYDWSSRFPYGNRSCVPDGTQAGCRNIKLWISAPLICRPVTNFHVRICGKCTPLFSGLQCKDSTKRRDCKLLGGIFVRGGEVAPPELFKDFKDIKVFNATQPPISGGCLKSAGVV